MKGERERAKIFGRVMGIQEGMHRDGIHVGEQVLILLESGEIHFVDLAMVTDVRLEDISAYSDLKFYMDALVSRGKRTTKAVTLFLDGTDHLLDISYISQMAPWRMSYRLFHTPDDTKLQCWGIVDNCLDEDLNDIKLTLISGKPISFIYDLYLAQTVKRQRIKEELRITTAPVELEGEKRTLEKGELELEEMREEAKQLRTTAAMPVDKALSQPPPAPMSAGMAAPEMGAGKEMLMDLAMECKSAAAPMRKKKMARARASMDMMMAKKMDDYDDEWEEECEEEPCESLAEGTYYGDVGGLISDFEESLEEEDLEEREATEVEDYGEGIESTVVSTEAVKLPEFFQYEIKSPVTIRRGQSAMVPILQESITCTREMMYNRIKTGKHPLIVMRVENKLGLRLERGPITILDDSEYVGEGILPTLDPEDEVRVAYAIATGIRVREENRAERNFREIELKEDLVMYRDNHDEHFKYVIENDTRDTVGVIIEHPRSETHKLHEMEDAFEVSDRFYRWKITVQPKKEVAFKVTQREILKEKFGFLSRSVGTYKEYLNDGKLTPEQFEKIKEVHDMNDRINRYRGHLDTLQNQESNMVNYLRILNDLASGLAFKPGEMNLRNRLTDKYFEAEYRLAKLRNVILELRRDIKYLNKALHHLYRPERSPDFEYRKLEEIPSLARLLKEQTVQYWYGENRGAVTAATAGVIK